MADTYGGAQLQSGITHGVDAIAEAIRRMGIEHKKQKDDLATVKGYLDIARSIQTTDPKTGKQKPFFSEDQIGTVQQALDMRDAKLAGAREAALGIGKNILQRATAAQQSAGGPRTTVQNGITYRQTHTGDWVPVNAPKRNEVGMTGAQQANLQLKMQDRSARQSAAQQSGVDKELKAVGLNRGSLFDPANMQPGHIVDGQFQTPEDISNNERWQYKDAAGNVQTTDFGDPTHVRVGYVAPQVDADTGKVISKGKPGTVLPTSQLQAYQDTAASAAGPQAVQALQWIRANPEDPLSQQVNSKLQQLVTQAGTRTIQPQSDTSTVADSEDNAQEPNAEPPADNPDTTDEEP